ncbi:MAG: ABC transporter substrate-binding protein [Desulfovibrionaceae bacterium]
MKQLSSVCAALLLVLLCSAPALAGQPSQDLREGLDRVLAILQDTSYDTTEGVSQKQVDAMREVVYTFVDFRELTKRAVGRPWLNFTDTQRNDLTAVFTELLEKTYLRKLNTEYLGELKSFSPDSISYLDEQVKGDKAMVYTRFQLSDKPLDVNFRMIKKDKWWAYDVIGEGLTLLGIYKDEFKNVLVNQSADDLINILRDKIKAIEEGREAEGGSQNNAS